jgi:channel protein (hemolysin III family)
MIRVSSPRERVTSIAYTIGVVFYSARRLRYHHLIWHLLVLVGASCHFLAIYWYAVGTMDLPSA